ncbi:MAG: MiaB/RimO family radical SAM methylthiotransferase [Candidatus Omnitrophota bacterium]|nr:MiaB/RimO family radical SAM methylthiotransferase [Candidatus Omnitrophota bacterium]
MKTFKIFTLGCKVNQYESQQIRERLLSRGFSEQDNGCKSDIYVINTCTVTSKADAKSFSLIRDCLKQNKHAQILVAGCFAKANSDIIKKNFGKKVVLRFSSFNSNGINDFKNHSRAFIKIQDGCNNHCAYCKVPLVRGNSRSRNLNSIIEEARRLIDKGFKEIVLCGICLGAYGRDLTPKLKLSNLLLALNEIKQNFRIRLSSIEAKDVSYEIIDIIANSTKVCKHLHIPFQSGDDIILKRMARKYTCEDYLSTVEKIRNKIPLIAITTDIMAGFPGETEENFQNTLNFLKRTMPSRMHCFPFSRRPGTKAFDLSGLASDETIRKRVAELLVLAKQMAHNYLKKFVGKELEVLIEAKPDKSTGFFKGYSDNYIYTLVKAKDLKPGQIIKAKANTFNSQYLIAKIINQPS